VKLPIVSKKKDNSHNNDFLVIDVTSKSLKCLLVDGNNAPYKVKGVSAKNLFEETIEASHIKQVVKECYVQAESTATNAVVGIGGPDVFGFMLIVKINRKEINKEINEKELTTHFAKIKNIASQQADSLWLQHHGLSEQLTPLDLVVTSFELSEGNVEDPVGKTSEFIKIASFCSFARASVYTKIINELNNSGITPIAVTTTLYSQVKLISKDTYNFLLIDIGAEYTDVAVVFGGEIVQTQSFSIAGDYFSAYLGSKLGLDTKKAEGKKESFALKSIPDDEADNVSDLLYEAGKDWRDGLTTILQTMVGIKSFPNKIFLSGGGADLELVQELLYEKTWSDCIPFANEVEIHKVKENIWADVIDDNLKIIRGTRMFAPSSLCAVKLELEAEQ